MSAKIHLRRLLRLLASLQLTVIGLLLMALLVVGGTILQAEKGVYAAQQEIFQSWVFWLFGVLPLPGMFLIGALLVVNLLCAIAFRLKHQWSGAGMLLLHVGLLALLAGGYISSQYAREYFLTLGEGESSRMASAAHEWELAAWTEAGGKKQVRAMDIIDLRSGRPWAFPEMNLELTVSCFFPNCRPAEIAAPAETILHEVQPAADPAENIPGAILNLRDGQGMRRQFRLFAGNGAPAVQRVSNRDWYFLLRLKRIILPLKLKLVDFKKTVHPGSEIPKSFTSRVEIESGGLRREALIAMNRPLRFGGYTFYQSSYAEEGPHGASSTLAVVRNTGRWLPYAASGLMFLGLVLHFFGQLAAFLKKSRFEATP